MTEAIALIQEEMAGVTIAQFAQDKRKGRLVERGLEINSEASRRLPAAMKARHLEHFLIFLNRKGIPDAGGI